MYYQKQYAPHNRTVCQLGKHYKKAGHRKWCKKRANRKMRQWAKLDPENAPIKQPYASWD